MTMTREDVAALVARLVGKTWYVTDSTGQRWADDAPEDAARALLAALDDLDAAKAERDALEADMSAGSFYKEADANWLVSRAEAADAANAAMTARNEALVGDVARLEACLAVEMGGCDANSGLEHSPISLPHDRGYTFCYACGETLTKAQAKVASSAAVQRRANAGEG